MAPEITEKAFTASNRIKQLNDIDRDIVRLLQSAGLAIRALTKSTSISHEDPFNQASLVQQQKESFTTATSSYFTLLSSLDVRLRRQIYALEEAEVLPTEVASKENQTNLAVPLGVSSQGGLSNAPSSKQTSSSRAIITGGGLGSLDVGWLNSRNDHVGKEMEAELWEAAQTFVDRFEGETINKHQEAEIQQEEHASILLSHQPQGSSEQMKLT